MIETATAAAVAAAAASEIEDVAGIGVAAGAEATKESERGGRRGGEEEMNGATGHSTALGDIGQRLVQSAQRAILRVGRKRRRKEAERTMENERQEKRQEKKEGMMERNNPVCNAMLDDDVMMHLSSHQPFGRVGA